MSWGVGMCRLFCPVDWQVVLVVCKLEIAKLWCHSSPVPLYPPQRSDLQRESLASHPDVNR